MANAATAAATAPQTLPSSAVPFKITTQPDGYLPDMQGFEVQRVGSLEKGWHSLCPIRAGRDLAKGEVISACQVRERDGELVRVDYTATEGALKADQWPQAFAKYIVEHGKGLSAGGWNEEGGLTCEGTEQLRLWCRNPYRAFTTAPFANNLVQALACDDDYVLANGQSLCLQVRDLATQHLYEHHVFTPSKTQAGTAWSKALCEQLNRDSRLVRAGVLNAEACTVTPAAKGNAFWVAQCAGLSVTLNEVNWWQGQVVQGSEALAKGQAVHAWVYDAYSHRLLHDFSWTPTVAQCAAGQWLEAWASALNASPLGGCLCASAAAPTPAASRVAKATQLTLWQRGEGLRMFTSLPASDNWVAGPRLDSVWSKTRDSVQVMLTVRHPYSRQLLEHEVFLPNEPADQDAWEAALAKAIGDKHWPWLVIGREGADGKRDRSENGRGAWRLWQPRYAGLLVELETLGDGGGAADQLGKYLLETDGELPDQQQRVGLLEKGWHSVCLTGAGRDLVEGEVISACQVRERDGVMVRVDYTAAKGALKADQWPQAFATCISEHGKVFSADGWNDQGGLTCEGSEQLQLWCRNAYRAFTTAPYANNLVQAQTEVFLGDALDGPSQSVNGNYVLADGQSLSLTVSDLTTGRQYEHHVFTPSKSQAGGTWFEALCEQINRDSRLVRAGELDAATCTVTPAATGNAFWAAQCSGVRVTLCKARWSPNQVVQGSEALVSGQAVQAWGYDAYSHRLLHDFSWTPTEAQCAAGQWLEAWASALNASPLGSCLCASAADPTPAASGVAKATQLTLWQRGDGLRVFTSLPASDNWVAGPRLDSVWSRASDAVLVTVRNPYGRQLLEHEVFLPNEPTDQSAWEAALAKAIGDKRWPWLVVEREDADGKLDRGEKGQGAWRLWQPRFAALLVELKNLGDGGKWSADQLGKYLLETDASPGNAPTRDVRDRSRVEASTRTYREGSALLYLRGCAQELVFRLSDQARSKGYRVADCYRETDSSYTSGYVDRDIAVQSCTSESVTWGKGRGRSAFRLVLDFPDASRDATQLTVGHVGYLDDDYLWQNVTPVLFTPPAALAAYTPSSPLCEDYGNTMGSEVFDAGPASRCAVSASPTTYWTV